MEDLRPAGGLSGSERVVASDLVELQQLAAGYWARADGVADIPIRDLFTDDAVFILGSLTMTGRAAIDEFFRERDAMRLANQRTTRHVACNFLATPGGEGSVLVRSTVLVYSGVGTLPLPASAPSGIADFEDVCVRVQPGCWKFARRIGRSVFIGDGAPAFTR